MNYNIFLFEITANTVDKEKFETAMRDNNLFFNKENNLSINNYHVYSLILEKNRIENIVSSIIDIFTDFKELYPRIIGKDCVEVKNG